MEHTTVPYSNVRLMVFAQILDYAYKKLALFKHSSLFCCSVIAEEKSFKALTLRANVIEVFTSVINEKS
jgi:hypothetical protein